MSYLEMNRAYQIIHELNWMLTLLVSRGPERRTSDINLNESEKVPREEYAWSPTGQRTRGLL